MRIVHLLLVLLAFALGRLAFILVRRELSRDNDGFIAQWYHAFKSSTGHWQSPLADPQPNSPREPPTDHCMLQGINMRKEIRDLTGMEWQKYTSALQSLNVWQASSQNETVFASFVRRYHDEHRQDQDSDEATAPFLPRIRRFLVDLETELRYHQPAVTIPYYDWSSESIPGTVSTVWTARYFGQSEAEKSKHSDDILKRKKGGCIADGAFANWTVSSLDDNDSGQHEAHHHDSDEQKDYIKSHAGCIQRGRYPVSQAADEAYMLIKDYSPMASPIPLDASKQHYALPSSLFIAYAILNEQTFQGFDRFVAKYLHHIVQLQFGGDFSSDMAAADPMFISHLAFLDRIWWMWQKQWGAARTSDLSREDIFHQYQDSTNDITENDEDGKVATPHAEHEELKMLKERDEAALQAHASGDCVTYQNEASIEFGLGNAVAAFHRAQTQAANSFDAILATVASEYVEDALIHMMNHNRQGGNRHSSSAKQLITLHQQQQDSSMQLLQGTVRHLEDLVRSGLQVFGGNQQANSPFSSLPDHSDDDDDMDEDNEDNDRVNGQKGVKKDESTSKSRNYRAPSESVASMKAMDDNVQILSDANAAKKIKHRNRHLAVLIASSSFGLSHNLTRVDCNITSIMNKEILFVSQFNEQVQLHLRNIAHSSAAPNLRKKAQDVLNTIDAIAEKVMSSMTSSHDPQNWSNSTSSLIDFKTIRLLIAVAFSPLITMLLLFMGSKKND